MRTRTFVIPLLLLVASFAVACGGGSTPVTTTGTAPAESVVADPVVDPIADAVKNLQRPPNAVSEDEATCIAEFVGADSLAMMDNFSADFRDEYAGLQDVADMDNGAAIQALVDGAMGACLVIDNGADAACQSAEGLCDYGDDRQLDALWDDCDLGDMQACDELYFSTAIGSNYEYFGSTCGGRESYELDGTCNGDAFPDHGGEGFVGYFAELADRINCDTVDGPCGWGENDTLDGLWDACEAGDLASCDSLYFQSAVGSLYEAFGHTCGDRQPVGDICDPNHPEYGGSGYSDTYVDCTNFDGVCGYGEDSAFDALWDQCDLGDGAACDSLYLQSPVGSRYEQFGYTCGDRGYEGSCEFAFDEGGH